MIRKNTQPIEGKSIERRSVTSHYHGSKISGCQQSFFDSEGHLHCRTSCRFAPVCNHAEENHTCQRFRSFYRLGPRFVEIHDWSCYHGNVTNDVSPLLALFLKSFFLNFTKKWTKVDMLFFNVSVLEKLNSDKVYIIGGLVDHHVLRVRITYSGLDSYWKYSSNPRQVCGDLHLLILDLLVHITHKKCYL